MLLRGPTGERQHGAAEGAVVVEEGPGGEQSRYQICTDLSPLKQKVAGATFLPIPFLFPYYS